MIVFSLSVVVPPTRRAELLKDLGGLLEPTRVLPGCVGCRLYTDCEDPFGFLLVQEWESQAALDRNLTSDAYKIRVATIELSTRPPAIRFDNVSEHAGIEVIAEARRAQGML